VFQSQDLGMQRLTREIDKGQAAKSSATIFWMIGTVANQWQSGMGRLDADLMFSTGLQPEPQFGDETFAAGERILRDDFVMRDGLAGFGARVFELRFRKHVLAQFVPAQLQPLPPSAGGRARTGGTSQAAGHSLGHLAHH